MLLANTDEHYFPDVFDSMTFELIIETLWYVKKDILISCKTFLVSVAGHVRLCLCVSTVLIANYLIFYNCN